MTALPDVFLLYQQRFARACFTEQVVVEEKSRRTGFSWAAAGVAAMVAAAAKSAGGDDVLYMGYNLEMAREFIDYVAEWARQIEPAAAEVAEYLFTDPEHPERDIRAFRISFASGFKVLALPSVPRALRGMQGLVIIDEAAFHDDLAALLTAAFALLIWGGRVVVISTHDGDTNPFNILVQDIRAGRKPYCLGRTTFDDALADGLYQRICLTQGKTWSPDAEAAWRAEIIAIYGDKADEELFVIPSASTGSYIPAPLIEARMQDDIPVLRWACAPSFTEWPDHLRRAEALGWCEAHLAPVLATLNPGDRHCFGEDFGRSGDLTVIWPLALGRDLVRRTPFVVELRGVPFEQQRQILFYIADRSPLLFAGALDATGNGAYLAEVTAQRFGNRILQVKISEAWYRDAMPPFKAAFEDGTIAIPRDREILTDIRALSLVRGVARIPQRLGTGTELQRHGDAAIAACLAYAASRSNIVPIEFEIVGTGRATADMGDYMGGLR
jgi:phage FluMu gp28-like protein